MLTQEQFAEKAFNAIDKSLYESIFFGVSGLGTVAVSSALTIGILIVAVMALFMYLDRNNGYTPGYHSRRDGSFWIAVIVILVPFFMFKPSEENIAATEKSLEAKMIAQIPIVVAEEIKNEKILLTKLQMIIDHVDSSGRLYYSTKSNEKVDANSKRFGNNIHHYISTNNYQAEYVDGVKTLEANYKKSTAPSELLQESKNAAEAKFLHNIFSKGNLFVVKNKAKANKYKKDLDIIDQKIKEREIAAKKEADRLQKEADAKVAAVEAKKI